jgi:hypothetical protein
MIRKVTMYSAYALMPFAPEFDIVYEILEREAQENGYLLTRADKKRDIGLITTGIVVDVINADIIFADISGFNPNVMYELGFAHTLGKPTILLSQQLGKNEKLPFDISHMVTIPYTVDADSTGEWVRNLREKLTRYINAQMDHANPIQNALSANKIKLFRSQFEYLWGLEKTFLTSAAATEVWILSTSLYWEQLSPLFNKMIEERTISGKRRTSLMLPDQPEMVDASEMYLASLAQKKPDAINFLRILHVPSEELFLFLPAEICIYDPYTPKSRAIMMEPMSSNLGEDPADAQIEENIASGQSNTIANLRENTFDVALSKNSTRRLSSVFRRVWNKHIQKFEKPSEWSLEMY